jgi:hypothetical protein
MSSSTRFFEYELNIGGITKFDDAELIESIAVTSSEGTATEQRHDWIPHLAVAPTGQPYQGKRLGEMSKGDWKDFCVRMLKDAPAHLQCGFVGSVVVLVTFPKLFLVLALTSLSIGAYILIAVAGARLLAKGGASRV